MTFYGWLTRNIYRSDSVGDFARDATIDSEFPHKPSMAVSSPGPAVVFRYLEGVGASDWAVEAAREAWTEYELYSGGLSKIKRGGWAQGLNTQPPRRRYGSDR